MALGIIQGLHRFAPEPGKPDFVFSVRGDVAVSGFDYAKTMVCELMGGEGWRLHDPRSQHFKEVISNEIDNRSEDFNHFPPQLFLRPRGRLEVTSAPQSQLLGALPSNTCGGTRAQD
jgi:hypothetical protein